jgi:hypothetical protein
MLRQGKLKHNKEQFEYPKSIVIPHCEGECLSLLPLIIRKVKLELMSEMSVACLDDVLGENLRVPPHCFILNQH